MASMQRKRGALGKRARFQQHGYDVDEERLERALKRPRPRMDTPDSSPTSLKILLTPTPSPQLAQIAPATQTIPITAPQLGDRMNTHPILLSPYNSHLQIASNVPRLDHASLEDNVGNDLGAGRAAMGSMSPSEWFALETLPNCFSDYQSPLVYDIEQILGSPLAEGGSLMLSRASSAQSCDSDWRKFLNLSPTTRSHSRTFGSLVSSPRQAQPGDPPSPQRFAPFSGARSSSVLSVPSSEINMRMNSNVHDPERHGSAARIPFDDDDFPARATIMLTFVLNDATNQTEALQVVLLHPPQDSWEWHISPIIRTFNIVPKNAEIITRVMMNDVQGITSLLHARKASARDADEFGSPGNAVTTIWTDFLSSGWYPSRPKKANLEDCIRITNTVLSHGCDISENAMFRPFTVRPNPIFVIPESNLVWFGAETAQKLIEHLLNLGYDAEERNRDGLTSLLFTASIYSPIVVGSLKALVRRNIALKATDPEGKGALHIALSALYFFDGWRTFMNRDHWPEFDAEHHNSEPLEYPTSDALHPADTPWLEKCVQDLTEDELEDWVTSVEDDDSPPRTTDDDHSPDAANQSFTDGHEIHEFEEWDPDDASVHRYWRFIRHWIPMLKRRMRSKVLTLLQAGCDPNHRDNDGESPSEFAQREGIWQEWTWALRRSGYAYDDDRDLWVRMTVSA
ncbi:MAG: hypothetical protein Q9179_000363 [Wetmoreana sp. 5 TL-2023]